MYWKGFNLICVPSKKAKAASNSPYVIRDLSPQFSSIVIVGSLPWAFIGKSATMWSSLDSIFIILFFTSTNLPLHLIADHFSTVMKLNTGNKEMISILHFQLQRNHSQHSYAQKNNTIVPIREVLFHAVPLENQFKETTLPVEVHSIRAVLPTYLLVSPSWWAISHIWRKWGFKVVSFFQIHQYFQTFLVFFLADVSDLSCIPPPNSTSKGNSCGKN